jgi:hypothetical protein
VQLDEALRVLGLPAGASDRAARDAYRRLVRERHPDVAGPADTARATAATARLIEAYAVVRRSLLDAEPTEPVEAEGSSAGTDQGATETTVDGDSLLLDVPADEAFAVLFEAAGRVGHVAYFDRHLGLLETVVRFEGGPTCSVLITLQGRAFGTEAFVTMESIEAAPTPPIGPVVDALVDELTRT